MLGGCKVKTISCHLSLLPNKCKYSIGGKNWVRAENLLTGKYFILWVTLYSDIYYIHDTFSCCLWARVEFLSQLTMEMKQDVQKWEVRKYMVYWKPAGSVAWPELRLLVTWDSRIWLTVGLSQALNVGVFIKDFQQGVAQTAVHLESSPWVRWNMGRGEQAQRMGAAAEPQETQGAPELSWGHWGAQSNARIQEGLREVK